jgi:hypothetical protein
MMAPGRDDRRNTARDHARNRRESLLNDHRGREPGQMTLGNECNDTGVIRQVTILMQSRMGRIIRRKRRHQQQKEHRHDRADTPNQPSLRKTVGRLSHAGRTEAKPPSHGNKFPVRPQLRVGVRGSRTESPQWVSPDCSYTLCCGATTSLPRATSGPEPQPLSPSPRPRHPIPTSPVGERVGVRGSRTESPQWVSPGCSYGLCSGATTSSRGRHRDRNRSPCPPRPDPDIQSPLLRSGRGLG